MNLFLYNILKQSINTYFYLHFYQPLKIRITYYHVNYINFYTIKVYTFLKKVCHILT